jgi:hypothetical protein
MARLTEKRWSVNLGLANSEARIVLHSADEFHTNRVGPDTILYE